MLEVTAERVAVGDPDGVELAPLSHWLTMARDQSGRQYAVFSDGSCRIRLDVLEGELEHADAVRLTYRLSGVASLEPRLLPLRRWLALVRHRRFIRSLFPPDPTIARRIVALRVHDALMDGASQRCIGVALFGDARVEEDWDDPSDSLRSRVRRLIREARAMAAGGYRSLLDR